MDHVESERRLVMRKDIEIPKVSDVYVAARKTFNEEHLQEEWNVYLINDKEAPLEIVLIVAKGHGDTKNEHNAS